jgi:hypothetical protein
MGFWEGFDEQIHWTDNVDGIEVKIPKNANKDFPSRVFHINYRTIIIRYFKKGIFIGR